MVQQKSQEDCVFSCTDHSKNKIELHKPRFHFIELKVSFLSDPWKDHNLWSNNTVPIHANFGWKIMKFSLPESYIQKSNLFSYTSQNVIISILLPILWGKLTFLFLSIQILVMWSNHALGFYFVGVKFSWFKFWVKFRYKPPLSPTAPKNQ